METKTNLNSGTLEKLRQLVQINAASEKGFEEAAHDIGDKLLATMFTELCRERRDNALELKKFMAWNGEEHVEESSYLLSWQRAWHGLRRLIRGGDTYAILAEAEQGEDAIKKAYEDVLVETAGSAMNDVLTRQYAIVKAGHDRVRDMREKHKVSAAKSG